MSRPTTLAAVAQPVRARSSARALVLALRRGELDRAQLLERYLARIDEQRALNAFLWADRDELLAQLRAQSFAGLPLAGLPVALKDNVDTAGIPTTSGSPVDADRLPAADAAAWRRLRDAGGAVLLGKTHLSEFAYRSHHPALGPVGNPRRPERATGGSSSGSAAAVAAGLAPVALGTDTGGSVRIPASYCGVVGLKPTLGLVSTEGVVPLSRTMDHVGVLAGSVADAALVLEQLVSEPLTLVDPETLEVPEPDPRSITIALDDGYFGTGAQRRVLERWRRSVRLLEESGCRIVSIRLAGAARWRAAQKCVLLREAWELHAERLADGAPYGEVFRSAMADASRISDARYERALQTRVDAIEQLSESLAKVDALLTPTTPTVAPPFDEGRRGVSYTRYTTLAALTGAPAISIPAGTGAGGLPVGVQLVGAPHTDARLVAVAALLERLLA